MEQHEGGTDFTTRRDGSLRTTFGDFIPDRCPRFTIIVRKDVLAGHVVSTCDCTQRYPAKHAHTRTRAHAREGGGEPNRLDEGQ